MEFLVFALDFGSEQSVYWNAIAACLLAAESGTRPTIPLRSAAPRVREALAGAWARDGALAVVLDGEPNGQIHPTAPDSCDDRTAGEDESTHYTEGASDELGCQKEGGGAPPKRSLSTDKQDRGDRSAIATRGGGQHRGSHEGNGLAGSFCARRNLGFHQKEAWSKCGFG
jgi:hypothetical protein